MLSIIIIQHTNYLQPRIKQVTTSKSISQSRGESFRAALVRRRNIITYHISCFRREKVQQVQARMVLLFSPIRGAVVIISYRRIITTRARNLWNPSALHPQGPRHKRRVHSSISCSEAALQLEIISRSSSYVQKLCQLQKYFIGN